MIKSMTRSSIKFELDGKLADIECEALLPGYGSPDFVIYANSLRMWEPPNESERITEAEKGRILTALQDELTQRNITFEIE